ncbi:unnamed protein product [Prunus armeniaca]
MRVGKGRLGSLFPFGNSWGAQLVRELAWAGATCDDELGIEVELGQELPVMMSWASRLINGELGLGLGKHLEYFQSRTVRPWSWFGKEEFEEGSSSFDFQSGTCAPSILAGEGTRGLNHLLAKLPIGSGAKSMWLGTGVPKATQS